MKFISFLLLFCVTTPPLLAVQQCEKDFFKTRYNDGYSGDISVLLIWFPVNAGSQSTLRVCSNETGLPVQRHCSYDRSTNATWEEINQHIKLINCSSIQTVCMEEPFQHYYIKKNYVKELVNNTWKTAHLGERADLEKPCLLDSGLPVTRLCEFNSMQLRAQWELLSPQLRNIECLRDTREHVITYNLSTLYQEVKRDDQIDQVQPEKVMREMTELLTTSQRVRVPADIKISSDILKIITENDKNPDLLTDVLNVTDIILDVNPEIVIKSGEVNATTTLLKTLDTYLNSMAKVLVPTDHCQNTSNGVRYETFKRTSVFYINPSCSNISGVAIYYSNSKHQRYDAHTGHFYQFIYLNQTLDQILTKPGLRLATYFPLSLWNKLKNETGGVDDQTVLAFIIFRNDLLFVNRTELLQRPSKRILEISIPNYSGELPEDVPFILSYRRRSPELPKCGYWNYSTWITTGVKTEHTNISDNHLLICHSTHLTHFASLFGISSFPPISLGDSVILSISHDLMLDYISILGCLLSLVGLSCIWLTAMCFKRWRAQTSNKVLMNMCFVITLLMLFFMLINVPDLWKDYIDIHNRLDCMIMGAYLHYNVLVLFFWMLIIAIMQYQRYVRVMGYERSSNFITKYAIIAWGVPLIPTILVAYFDPDTYRKNAEQTSNKSGICYPSDKSLYYGVILPMAVIMLTNLGIFIFIFCSLRRKVKFQVQQQGDNKRIVAQIKVSVLLFFLLGISWIFGFLTHLDNSPVFSYLFCLTSTLQGFVLFLYSIVIDKSTRSSWLILCCAKSYYTMEDTSIVTRLNNRS
ncbi:adhesion G-protein coupled receptor G4-like [Calliphora vicina]|uniref:adhesion G-protein coupled receptor G4-like n=1 Tax=Calliphora vicina TaxID=7373 RepID=UPI00325B7FBC